MKNNKNSNNNIALFACAKNEHDYIYEWIYYHLKIGFDHIYICDTSDDNNMKSCTFNTDPRITILHEPLHGKSFGPLQPEFYTKYNNEIFKSKYKWCAFIDVDEFIVPKTHANIKNLLNSINFDIGSLGINWVLFGNNNKENKEKIPVIKRFTRCKNIYDRHVKSIVNTNSVHYFNNPHFAFLSQGNQVNEKGKQYNKGPWQENSSVDLIQINHYVVKSTEEYLIRTKNHHCRDTNIKDNSHFKMHNCNDIEDKTVYNILMSNSNHSNINEFDYEFYIQYYDDLLVNGIFNKELAYNHYINNGIKENRISNLNFNYHYYKLHNKDLEKLSNIELWNHFKNNGLKENRKYKINN